jgi:hypothetical protein
MPPSGTYLLTNVGFSKDEKPILVLQHENDFLSLHPIGESLTMTFDRSQRHCVGWRDMEAGKRFTCPNHHTTISKYEQCAACQKRTGFNPAFYHATTVSTQQEARNLEPHILYLAHFGPGVVKVGISHSKRGHTRLLEQGARSALILDELPSAHVARQYEARISKLPGIVESLQVRKKISLAITSYDFTAARHELTAIKQMIETSLGIKFTQSEILTFDTIYFPNVTPRLSDAQAVVQHNYISGLITGMMGSLLFCMQQDKTFYIPLKKYVGYHVTIDPTVRPIAIEPQQISLF